MPAQLPLYQEVYHKIYQVARKAGVRKTSVIRLALLLIGIFTAKNVITAVVASELFNLKLTQAPSAESIQRRIRRTLNDKKLF